MANVLKAGVAGAFGYDTPKMVHIPHKSIGILNRLIQITIIGYILGYVIIFNRGYQLVDRGLGGTTTKVKGVAFTNETDSRIGTRVWDAVDIVVPPEENNAFFVTTNVIVTNNQTQGECPESTSVAEAKCSNDSSCHPIGRAYQLGHGVSTGVCNGPTTTCVIKAWCPLEVDQTATDYAALNETKQFTVLLKNHVYFPYYKRSRTNIRDASDKRYLQRCTYDDKANKACPVFRLNYIVEQAQKGIDSAQSYAELARDGAVISVKVVWRCNFDVDWKLCNPTYEFARLDQGEDSKISKGYNYRYTKTYFINGVETRQLVKAYGILFLVTTDATAAAFDIATTLLNIGSGIGLLTLASVICDIVVLYIHKSKAAFKQHKYERLNADGSYSPISEQQETPS